MDNVLQKKSNGIIKIDTPIPIETDGMWRVAIIAVDKAGNTSSPKLVEVYKDTIKTEKSGYRVAVCDFCGTSFKARREPSSINGIFAFGFSLVVCTLAAVVIRMLVVLI